MHRLLPAKEHGTAYPVMLPAIALFLMITVLSIDVHELVRLAAQAKKASQEYSVIRSKIVEKLANPEFLSSLPNCAHPCCESYRGLCMLLQRERVFQERIHEVQINAQTGLRVLPAIDFNRILQSPEHCERSELIDTDAALFGMLSPSSQLSTRSCTRLPEVDGELALIENVDIEGPFEATPDALFTPGFVRIERLELSSGQFFMVAGGDILIQTVVNFEETPRDLLLYSATGRIMLGTPPPSNIRITAAGMLAGNLREGVLRKLMELPARGLSVIALAP